jgi:nucleoside-diphosphate-sugar epimerase
MNPHTSAWRGRRVLVTGCTGFLGGAVTRELLDRGATVVGLVRQRSGGREFAAECDAGRFHVIHGRAEDDARLHSAMAVHEVSAVFHLAGAGLSAVLRAAALYHPRVPVVTVRPAEQLRLAADDDEPPVPLGVARFGELFGPGDRKRSGVVPRTLTALLEGKPNATAGPARDFVFVRDAARACLSLAEAVGAEARPRDCTFRSGWEFTESALAALVADVFAGRAVDVPEHDVPNPFGWQPVTPFAAAIRETIAWYRESVRTRPAEPRRRAA